MASASPSAPTKGSVPPDGYVVGIEWIRLVACIAIIAFHIGVPGELYALGGLHAFTAVTAAFTVRSAQANPLAKSVRRRVKTLVVPWLFWCVFYALFIAADGLRHGEDPFPWLTPRALLMGPSIHLWFLPFAFLVGLLLHAPARRGGKAAWLAWLSATPLATAASCALENAALPEPFGQWSTVLPGVTLGACVGQLAPSERAVWPKLGLVVGVVTLTLLSAIVLGYRLTALPLLVGLVPVVVAWGSRRSSDATLIALSGLSFGIYLVHPFVGRLWHGPLARLPWAHFAATALGSLLVVFALRKTPLRRFV